MSSSNNLLSILVFLLLEGSVCLLSFSSWKYIICKQFILVFIMESYYVKRIGWLAFFLVASGKCRFVLFRDNEKLRSYLWVQRPKFQNVVYWNRFGCHDLRWFFRHQRWIFGWNILMFNNRIWLDAYRSYRWLGRDRWHD